MTDDERKKWVKEVLTSDLDLNDRLTDSELKLLLAQTVQPVVFFDTLNQRIAGNRVESDIRVASHLPVPNTDTIITVPAGEVWEIQEIYAFMICDVNAANRVFDIVVGQTISTIAQSTIDISGITLTATQLGGLIMTAGFAPNLWTNDNGVLAVVADENPLPITLKETDNINGVATNKEAGDVLELLVYYKKVQ